MLPLINSARASHRVALVDCNNFYASCERVFRPQWRHRPVGVLSNNDGCIIACSDELKAAGVKIGTPYFKHRDLLDKMGAVIVSSNYTLYGDMSARVMATLGLFVPSMEIYSIDEAWLDFGGFDPLSLTDYGKHVVAKVQKHTGIPVSMGIAPTKTLAKVANRWCKKNKIPGGVFHIDDCSAIDDLLHGMDIQDVWGIGARWAEKLRAQGIRRALDLKRADPMIMRKRYNVIMQRLIYELNGHACLGSEDVAPKKEIIASRSFGQRVMDKNALLEAVSHHATRAAEKLRQQKSVCGCVRVAIRTGRFNPQETFYGKSLVIHLPSPTRDTRVLIQAARRGVEKIFQPGHRYAKAGIMLMDLTPQGHQQPGLFHQSDSDTSEKLMATLDQVNRLYGKNTLRFAAEGVHQPWAMKRDTVTPAYTTNWRELPTALAV